MTFDSYVDAKDRLWLKADKHEVWATYCVEHPTTGDRIAIRYEQLTSNGGHVKFPDGTEGAWKELLYSAAHPSKGLHSPDYDCAVALAKGLQ